MIVWILAAVMFAVALAVVAIPRRQRHHGGMCAGLWFRRRITMRDVPLGGIDQCLRHEIAHHELYHTEKLLVVYAAALAAGAVVANLTPLPVVVFLLLGVVANLGTMRLQSYFERQADERSKMVAV